MSTAQLSSLYAVGGHRRHQSQEENLIVDEDTADEADVHVHLELDERDAGHFTTRSRSPLSLVFQDEEQLEKKPKTDVRTKAASSSPTASSRPVSNAEKNEDGISSNRVSSSASSSVISTLPPLPDRQRFLPANLAIRCGPRGRDVEGLETQSVDQSEADSESLMNKADQMAREYFDAGKNWWRHPKIRSNTNLIAGSVLLTILGIGLFCVGLASVAIPIKCALFFIPGAYHTVYVTCIACGRPGYRFGNLPTFAS